MVSMGCVDISGVEAATLALGLNTLTVARLCNTSITTIQLEALLRSVQYSTVQYSSSPPYSCHHLTCTSNYHQFGLFSNETLNQTISERRTFQNGIHF